MSIRFQFIAPLLVVFTTVSLLGAQARPAETMLEAARKMEVVDGNYQEAVKQYGAIVDRFATTDRPAAAAALIRMAECQQKLGNSQAKATLERVVKEFSDQTSQVAEARARLTGLAGPAVRATADGRAVLICEGEGCSHRAGAISRDGKWIVMGGAVWGGGSLGLRNVATGEVTRLPVTLRAGDEKRQANGAVFSADGRQIAFAWGDGYREIRVIRNEPGAKARVLVDLEGSTLPLAWSRDGGRILVSLRLKDESLQLAWVSTADGAIKVVQSVGWRTRAETGFPEVSISPDERFIVYSALVNAPSSSSGRRGPFTDFASAEQHLYAIPADGNGPEIELTKTRGIDHNPIWSADGRHILFSSDRTGGTDLYALPITSGNVPGVAFRVKSDIGTYFNTGVTDSGFLYFWQLHPALREVHIADMDTTGKLPATPRLTGRIPGRLPSWSPDGKQLAMAEAGANTGDDRVLILSFQSGETQIVASPGSPDKPAIWLPDSRGFLQVVRSPRGAVTSTWTRFEPNTSTLQVSKHLGNPGFFSAPVLSPDARRIYRLGGEVRSSTGEAEPNGEYSEIVAVDTSTAAESVVFNLANHRGSAMGPALSPDGRLLAFQWQPSQKLGSWILATVAIDGSAYREITTTERPASALSWTRDGRGILFAENAGRASKCRLMRVSTEGGSQEFTGLESAPGGVFGCSFSVSSDGKRIAFQTSQDAQELWALDVSEAALLRRTR